MHPSLWPAGTSAVLPGGRKVWKRLCSPILTALEETGGFLWLAALISSELQEHPCTFSTAISRLPLLQQGLRLTCLQARQAGEHPVPAMHACHSTMARAKVLMHDCSREGGAHILSVCPGIHAAPGPTDAHCHQGPPIMQHDR